MYTHPDRIAVLVAKATELLIDDESLFEAHSVVRGSPLEQLSPLVEHVGKLGQAFHFKSSGFDVHEEAIRVMSVALGIAIATDPIAATRYDPAAEPEGVPI